MKIAVGTKNWTRVNGHAGQTRCWLVFDLTGVDFDGGVVEGKLPEPVRVELTKEQVFHNFQDEGPHPLDGVDLVIAGSAGDGFVRHLKKRGADVLLTGETDPARALTTVLAGEALPDPRFDVTTTLCKVRDLFSRH